MKNLNKRKALAARVLGVGKGRITLDVANLNEIKEAITKQDIRDMYESGVISIRDIKGRKTKEKRKTRRGPGKIKMKIKPGKRRYIRTVRKLRNYIYELKSQGKMDKARHKDLRIKIKAGHYKDKAHLKEMEGLK